MHCARKSLYPSTTPLSHLIAFPTDSDNSTPEQKQGRQGSAMVYQTPRLTLLSLLTAVFLLGFAPVSALDFTWPANTVQCGIIPMNITGGSPPYTFNIL